MKLGRIVAAASLLLAVATASADERPAPHAALTGLNLAGAEFGDIGGTYGTSYQYPTEAEIDDVARRGFSVIRLPFAWERLQPTLFGDFDTTEWRRLDAVLAHARARHVAVIVDPHAYARWNGETVGSEKVPSAALADLWWRLALRLRGQDGIIFGLMNEPHDMSTDVWAAAAQGAIDAIRAAGACNRILVPGNAWTGAHSWASDSYGTPNAVAMAGVHDRLGKTSFEFHQYLDADWSGRAATCRPADEVVSALAVATTWLEAHGATGFLGEIGAGSDPVCVAGLNAMLAHMDAHLRAWRGWTAWAAGSWWPADYPLLLRPHDGRDPPQLAAFEAWRAPVDRAFASATCPVRPGRRRAS